MSTLRRSLWWSNMSIKRDPKITSSAVYDEQPVRAPRDHGAESEIQDLVALFLYHVVPIPLEVRTRSAQPSRP